MCQQTQTSRIFKFELCVICIILSQCSRVNGITLNGESVAISISHDNEGEKISIRYFVCFIQLLRSSSVYLVRPSGLMFCIQLKIVSLQNCLFLQSLSQSLSVNQINLLPGLECIYVYLNKNTQNIYQTEEKNLYFKSRTYHSSLKIFHTSFKY